MDDSAAPRPGSVRRSILVWLIPATVAIGTVALVDTRFEALRVARDVSDRVLIGSAMAIAEGVSIDTDGQPAISIPFSALAMLSSTAQDQVFYRVDGPDGFLTGYRDLSPVALQPGGDIGVADATHAGTRVRTATILRELTSGNGAVPFSVTVAETTREREATAWSILTRSALRIGGLILGAALVAWAAATYALRPLARLSRTIARRAPHDTAPFDAGVPAELSPVVEALNDFIARLSRAMAAMSNFAGNANHQIRTPLTIARTQIGMAAEPDRHGQRPALEKADRALIRIERVLEQVLILARIEATGARPALHQVDVAALVRDVTAELLPMALGLGMDLGYEGPVQAAALSEEVLLGELVRNLVDNALRHCPAETMVTVRVGQEGADGTRLSVADTGPAISDAQLALLRSRLDRAGGGSEMRTGTHGLGLHIVAEVADALRIEMRLDRGEGGRGLVWSAILPAPAEILPGKRQA